MKIYIADLHPNKKRGNLMENLKSIAEKIYLVCYDVDKNITGLPPVHSEMWAKPNSMRHARTILSILNYAKKHNKNKLKILNASGISCGHQDFSIVKYLKDETKLEVEWTVFESPESRFIKIKRFKKYINDTKIKLEISDFSKAEVSELFGPENNFFDIVIFTEIAEHLDYSTLLSSLSAIRRKIKNDGILIITTPNLMTFPNKIRILFGNGILPYMGDGTENLNKGIYGHIVFYDTKRLKRILQDIGFETIESYTFNWGEPDLSSAKRRLLIKLNGVVSYFFRNNRETIFIEAKKSIPMKIPLVVPSQI